MHLLAPVYPILNTDEMIFINNCSSVKFSVTVTHCLVFAYNGRGYTYSYDNHKSLIRLGTRTSLTDWCTKTELTSVMWRVAFVKVTSCNVHTGQIKRHVRLYNNSSLNQCLLNNLTFKCHYVHKISRSSPPGGWPIWRDELRPVVYWLNCFSQIIKSARLLSESSVNIILGILH